MSKLKAKVKLKTNRGAAKRFKRTGTGAYKHRAAFRNHILTHKSTKRKRHLRGMHIAAKADQKTIDRMLKEK